ncbi:hypothetical protein PPYR_01484 [Photinus pyralis]|uniref:Digestive organ expansion factor homolog n=1 Tax=Photinus pyralis TaxID=7054 RepID=A0A5N4B4N6_PHOPY|nr:digestive organ expansion factor homolog [Photinus pyralis]KAB0804514.1 hypothetical protein PPYR_01484 [Photinus pyralis]
MPQGKKRTIKGKQHHRPNKRVKGKKTVKKSFNINKKFHHNRGGTTGKVSDKNEPSNQQPLSEEKEREDQEDEVESSEEENDMEQLLQTFDSKAISKKSLAIDSSEDSMSDDDVVADETCSESEEKDVEDVTISRDLIEKDEIDLENQKEDDNLQDPFARHLFYELSESLLNTVQSSPVSVDTHVLEWPQLGKLQVQIPQDHQNNATVVNCGVIEKKMCAASGGIPLNIPISKCKLESMHIKLQLIENLAKANKSRIPNEEFPFSPLQAEIFSVVNNYQDFYYPHRTFENAEEIRFIYCLHIINHILKTRTKVLHHNARLAKKEDVPEEFRDQGLVRPKILVVVPFRDSAYKIVSYIIDLLITEDKGNVLNKNRFIEEFTGHELTMPKKNPKPEDYEKLFTGNTGDDFRIGITVTKKSLKLFANFYSSDILIASPLGLRTIIGAEGEAERDFDFLASIELLIMDQTEIFLMQNWDHIFHLFNHLHLQPKESHGTDFSRVRTWSLNGWAKYYRQTVIIASIVLPEINTIFNKKCFNYAGKVRCIKSVSVGSICQVFNQLPHVFQKFNADSVAQSMEARFTFFINKIIPHQREPLMKQTFIYISNYFEFVKIRNYFKREDISFVQVCEYSKEGKVARARDMFFHGDAHFMLYTERYHFFNRVRVKGIRHLVFYQPPTFPNFYYEMCNLMQEANMNSKIGSNSNMTVTILYSKYDHNQIAEIVGTERGLKMIQSDRNVHMLVTDGK